MNVEPNNKPTVIKVGGSTLEDTGTTFQDIATRTKNGEQNVVVHGGGPAASQWLKKKDGCFPITMVDQGGLVILNMLTSLYRLELNTLRDHKY